MLMLMITMKKVHDWHVTALWNIYIKYILNVFAVVSAARKERNEKKNNANIELEEKEDI